MIARTEDGREVFYTVSGTGPDILILHGAASDADTMAPLGAALSGEYRIIRMDRLGYRRSSQLTEDTNVREQANAVEAVRRASASEPVWICGHSSGANVAAGYATLFADRVRGLVLIEPPMYALFPEDYMPETLRTMKEEIMPLFETGEITEGIRRFTRHLEIPAETWNALSRSGHGKNTAENWPPLRYELKFAHEWPQSGSALRSLTHPVLILEGSRTTALLRGAADRLIEALPHSERLILPDCDHLAPIVEPELVAAKVSEFIRKYNVPR